MISIYLCFGYPNRALLITLKFFSDSCKNPGPYVFKSSNYPDYYLSLKSGTTEGYIEKNNIQSFLVVPCLAGNADAVSLQLYTKQNFYLKTDNNKMLIDVEARQTNSAFDLEACFKIKPDRFKVGYVAFESVSKPNHFIRHQGYRLKLHKAASDDLYKKDASFAMTRDC